MSAIANSLRSARRRWRLGRDCAGNMVVEFALALPVLLLLMLGSAELGRFVLLNQKMDRVATTVADLVARAETISESELADIFTAVGQVALPFTIDDLGVVIVTGVSNLDGTGAVIAWQRSGGGTQTVNSVFGYEGEAPQLAEGFEVREGETAIISEVFYDFTPFLSERVVESQTIHRTAHHRPRLGTLSEIEPG